MHWLSALINLESLMIICDEAADPAHVHIILPESSGSLGQLASFHFDVGEGTMELTVSWYIMQSLHDVNLTAGTLYFSESMSGLAQLDRLEFLHMSSTKFANEDTFERFATFLYYMGTRRPAVTVYCARTRGKSTLDKNILDFEAHLRILKSANNSGTS